MFDHLRELVENPKQACGEQKPPMHLIPPSALIAESIVMGIGAKKYGAFNWRRDAVRAMTYVGAIYRHLAAWLDGEDNDPESGQSHLAHIRGCCGVAIDAQSLGQFTDDRPEKGMAGQAIRSLTKPATAIGIPRRELPGTHADESATYTAPLVELSPVESIDRPLKRPNRTRPIEVDEIVGELLHAKHEKNYAPLGER